MVDGLVILGTFMVAIGLAGVIMSAAHIHMDGATTGSTLVCAACLALLIGGSWVTVIGVHKSEQAEKEYREETCKDKGGVAGTFDRTHGKVTDEFFMCRKGPRVVYEYD